MNKLELENVRFAKF